QASGNPLYLLTNGANYVVIGEGEVTFPKLIQSIVKMDSSSLRPHSVPGIAFLDEQNNVVTLSKRKYIDLNDFCPYSIDGSFPLHPPIEIMRGCAFRCRFCQVPYLYGNPRYRSIDNIIKIVDHYYQYFHPLKKEVDIRFIAPNSLGYQEKKRGLPNVEVLKDLIRRIREFDVRIFMGTFPSEVRPEYITEDVVDLFSQVDNTQISVGFQSGSDKILQEMRRGHSVEAGLNASDLLTDHGYVPVFDFILGNPNESEDDQWATLKIIRDLGRSAQARLHYFMPLPGTPWASKKPTPLFPNVHSEIGRLAREELISGDFDRQLNFMSV
ncbi:MAG: TIGR04013 family B12-binding domain/radical SAM domain-containing protein, partial [Candidatus Hodarchaeales archaeon]